MDSAQLSEQKDTLLKKLADTEAENAVSCLSCLIQIYFCLYIINLFFLQTLVVKLQEKERQINELCRSLDTEKVHGHFIGYYNFNVSILPRRSSIRLHFKTYFKNNYHPMTMHF